MTQSIRIILVDDHTLFRSGVKALLQRQPDFEVIGEASDGLEGVKLSNSWILTLFCLTWTCRA